MAQAEISLSKRNECNGRVMRASRYDTPPEAEAEEGLSAAVKPSAQLTTARVEPENLLVAASGEPRVENALLGDMQATAVDSEAEAPLSLPGHQICGQALSLSLHFLQVLLARDLCSPASYYRLQETIRTLPIFNIEA
eukprot:scaffold66695_cov33-Prasinocladus_malaysianus.AAC.1